MDIIPSAVLPLALILNELSTNSTKYGALSNPAGRVSLRWTCDLETNSFFLWWEEKGGPPAVAPRDKGFGSRLLGCAIPSQLAGEGHLSFPESGVRYSLRTTLARIAWRGPATTTMAG